jgi:hypothetical protein
VLISIVDHLVHIRLYGGSAPADWSVAAGAILYEVGAFVVPRPVLPGPAGQGDLDRLVRRLLNQPGHDILLGA